MGGTHDWLYAKGVHFLPRSVFAQGLAHILDRAGHNVAPHEVHRSVAADATTKLLLATDDGETIETV